MACTFYAMKYHITLVESKEGWAAWCDELPGCYSQGETREEALANIREAITEWLSITDDELEKIREENKVRNIHHEEVLV